MYCIYMTYYTMCILNIWSTNFPFEWIKIPFILHSQFVNGMGWSGQNWSLVIQVKWRNRPPDCVWNSLSGIEATRKMRKAADCISWCQTKPLMRKTKAFGKNTAVGSALWLCARWCDQWSDKTHTQTSQLILIIHVDNSCLSGCHIDPRRFSLSALSASVSLSLSDQSPLPLMKL